MAPHGPAPETGRPTRPADRHGRYRAVRRIHQGVLAAATCLLALSLSAIGVTHAAHQGQERRSADRTPQQVTAGAGHGTKPVALWRAAVDTVGDFPHDVVSVIPLVKGAAPPPGLPRWPEPGEAFLSPGLMEAGKNEGMNEGVASRYGRFAGVVAKEGLESPGERFAYVRPLAKPADKESMWEISGFGRQEAGFPLGRHMYVYGVDRLYWGLLGLAVLPSLLLAAVAARGINTARERKRGHAHGGQRPPERGPCVWLPIALGMVASCAVSLGAQFTDLPIPGVDFVLDRGDVRSAVPLTGAAHLVALVTVSALLAGLRRRRPGSPKAPKSRRSRYAPHPVRVRRGCCRLFFLALLVVARGTDLAPESARLTVYLTALALTLVCAPAVVATALTSGGGLLARTGRRRGITTLHATGVTLKRYPLPLAALLSAVVVSFILASQVLLWNGMPGDLASEARGTRERVGTSIVEMNGEASAGELKAFEAALPDKARLLAARDREDDAQGNPRVELVGACEALHAFTSPCSSEPREVTADGDARLREFMRWHGLVPARGALTATHGSPARDANGTAQPVQLIVLGDGGAALSVPALKRAAHQHLSVSHSVDTPGATWIVGTGPSLEAARWALLLSCVMVFCVVAAAVAGVTTAASAMTPAASSRQAAPLALRTRLVALVVLVALPLATAGLSAVLGTWLASPMDTPAWPAVTIAASAPLMYAVAAAAVPVTVVFLLLGARPSVRAPRTGRTPRHHSL
ncbi:hypothetical protein A6A06_27595 [Streptomyces sp. CB02923]|nr:hypothetical protein A6A06_27595 [Streptomyces sp. CB02923]